MTLIALVNRLPLSPRNLAIADPHWSFRRNQLSDRISTLEGWWYKSGELQRHEVPPAYPHAIEC